MNETIIVDLEILKHSKDYGMEQSAVVCGLLDAYIKEIIKYSNNPYWKQFKEMSDSEKKSNVTMYYITGDTKFKEILEQANIPESNHDGYPVFQFKSSYVKCNRIIYNENCPNTPTIHDVCFIDQRNYKVDILEPIYASYMAAIPKRVKVYDETGKHYEPLSEFHKDDLNNKNE